MWIARLPESKEELVGLETFDFTKLSAVNTCPTWGIVRYGMHKVMNENARAMALEAGEACHQAFGALRLLDLMEYGPDVYGTHVVSNRAATRMVRLYGDERADQMAAIITDRSDDITSRAVRLGIYTLETSGFTDDERDKRRTMDKLIESIMAYVQMYEWGKNVPYVKGDFVGVENPFDLVVCYEYHKQDGSIAVRKCRFTGRIDGVHCHRNDTTKPYVEENKTASRLGDAWEASFEMSHQVTGYAVAASAIVGTRLTMARVRGLSIPQPKYGDGTSTVTVFRHEDHISEWASWFTHTAELYFTYKNRPDLAPKYTHSCNRYFRPCSMIPYCAAPFDERKDVLDDMAIQEWSPLADRASD